MCSRRRGPADPDRAGRERAEIERSSVEAGLTSEARLLSSAHTRQRYLCPPADTAYPLEFAFHLLGDVHGARVLDFGCGSGGNTVLLAARGARVVGLDLSEDLLTIARRRMRLNGLSALFAAGSAHALPFFDASFDVVFGNAILHHLDLRLAAREIHRVLRPGGRAIFREPVRNSAIVTRLRALVPFRAPDISPFERPLTDPELREFAAPFSSLQARGFSLPHVRAGHLLGLRGKRLDALYRSDRTLLRAVPALGRYTAIRVFAVTR